MKNDYCTLKTPRTITLPAGTTILRRGVAAALFLNAKDIEEVMESARAGDAAEGVTA